MELLHSQSSTIVIVQQANGPCIRYIGPRLSADIEETEVRAIQSEPLPNAGMDDRAYLSVASTYADPTFMEPALKILCQGRHWAPQWQLQETSSSPEHIEYRLLDTQTGLLLVWRLRVSAATDVFTLDCRFENSGTEPIAIVQWLATLPIPKTMSAVKAFTGRWVHEFQPQDCPIPLGSVVFKNIKGRSSHDHFPGLLIADAHLSEHSGPCFGFHLGWSGNHCQRVERSQNGLTQYQAGIELMPGELELAPGASFKAAPLYFTHTEQGLGGIAQNFQGFVRAEILSFPTNQARPVHINTWEAIYFDHRQSELDALIVAAQDCGIERFVLDDGWFNARRNDGAGLGDWVVDSGIYPEGLHPLTQTLATHQLSFGLWFEPEMVNKDSDLFRQHPDWLLQLDDLHQSAGRNQWVLDISRDAVQDHLFNQIDSLLREYPIEYIKWDMNRDLSQAGNSQGRPVYHSYVNSLYRLLARLRAAHPSVEIESCASGGGRMDYGILRHTQRFWLSDCNDANERQTMQQWASLFFPSEVLGSHVGPDKSHTTSRSHALSVRAGTALFGHMGVEWDIRQASADDKQALTRYIQLYKELRGKIHSGVRRPLQTPDKHQIGFTVAYKDGLLVSIFQQTMPELAIPGPLLLPLLDPQARYQIKVLIRAEQSHHLMKQQPDWLVQEHLVIGGELLVRFGLELPILDPESLLVLQFNRVV
ncbi:alpha-galactosidase [Reinekea sp.]|jgi:alpha-galactosidase|uniref:alpha-galactosidase n=1 Tax=Reinekea sp. TaxID=1970455 RepID=UPI002A815F35|nr:alpha-galactosidase [Reinekea sp.]